LKHKVVPQALKGVVSQEQHDKSQEYSRAKVVFLHIANLILAGKIQVSLRSMEPSSQFDCDLLRSDAMVLGTHAKLAKILFPPKLSRRGVSLSKTR
jgi:hypothetical protein